MFSLEGLNKDLAVLNARKDQALHSFHQILGAISILEQYVQKLLNPEEAVVENPVEVVPPAE